MSLDRDHDTAALLVALDSQISQSQVHNHVSQDIPAAIKNDWHSLFP